MQGFGSYVGELKRLVRERDKLSRGEWRARCFQSLNGEPGRRLRQAVELSDLRASGAFFTGPKLAEKALRMLGDPKDRSVVYLDPTCGAGDLLLAAGRTLPLGKTLKDTLRLWGRSLAGYDTSAEFIQATKARLTLLAMRRLGDATGKCRIDLDEEFPLVLRGNALEERELFQLANRIILNPPFCMVEAGRDCEWAEGIVNASAVFVETVANKAKQDARIAAILPDVLRSGSRYERWRTKMQLLGKIHEVRSHGSFDRWADVDVFLLGMSAVQTVEAKTCDQWIPRVKRGVSKVSDLFDVRVGPVVPHRDKKAGRELRYIHARSLPAWGTVKRVREKRRFKGTTFTPPFVAVRRTSSPNDNKRAVATIVLGKKKTAVENHLLVLVPKDGRVTTCRRLMRQLRSSKTDEWLNRRIRCRHLTVSALSEMPWWQG